MIMTQKWCQAGLFADHEIDGINFGNDANAMEAVLSFNRFCFEDLGQAALQIIFLIVQEKSMTSPVSIYVITSVSIAVVLSCIRTIVACSHENACSICRIAYCLYYELCPRRFE